MIYCFIRASGPTWFTVWSADMVLPSYIISRISHGIDGWHVVAGDPHPWGSHIK